jgi:prepilin-type N-terminal cleavage/methylation domain-containing protein
MLRSRLGCALRSQSGVSIIEVLIASVIVAIAGVGTALMFGSGQAYVNSEGDNRVSTYLAQERIEQLRALGFSNLTAPTSATTETVNITPAGTTGAQAYSRVWSVSCVNRDDYTSAISCSGGAFPPAKLITVTVEPTPAAPKARAVTLVSVLSNR